MVRARATSRAARAVGVAATSGQTQTQPIQRRCSHSSAAAKQAHRTFRHPKQQRTFASATMSSQASFPVIHDFFEESTGSWQYIVADAATLRAAIIDPVLDYDPATATISTQTADALLTNVDDMGYTVDMILETHAHADHITAASYLQARLTEMQGERPVIGIGRRIAQVQDTFGCRYNIDPQEFDGVFDKYFQDDELFKIGSLDAMAMHIPGHTPDHMGYRIGGEMLKRRRVHAPTNE